MKICTSCRRKYIDSQPDCPLDRAPLQPATGEPPPGLGRELGTYRLIGLLGTGGMGSIYIASHALLKRYVAIKVLRPELASKRELVARFFAEARTVNQLKHPNIVESIDMVEDVIDGAYTVLELLRGPNLKQWIEGGALPADTVVHVGAQIADALAAVHAQGIVHRDLKPENLILISRDGRNDFVKLIDFGVAQVVDEAASGVPFGTPAYMAPEQAAGARVDGRADLYSLGVLLFEMTTGRHPFPSTSDHEYILRHADEAPSKPSSLIPSCPRALEDIIMKCLAKQPQQRFASAAELAAALRGVDPRRRSRAGKWMAGVLAIGAAAAAAVYLVPRYLEPSAQQAAAAPAPPVTAPAPAAPAPAPAPAPAAPAAPAEATPDEAPAPGAATVEIDVVSVPAGATVYRAGETIPLGTTPFTATLLRSDKKAHLRFELSGYDTHTTDIKVDESHEVTVRLARRAVSPTPPPALTPPPPPPPKKPSGLQREGTIDPFAAK